MTAGATSGSVQTVVVCTVAEPTGMSASASTICRAQDLTTTRAYLLAPDSQHAVEASLEPFNYAKAAGFWTVAFSMVVGLYVVTKGIGAVLHMLRRG